MNLHAALAATATLLASAFALSTLDRWLRRRKPQELAWTVSLAMFALGALFLWLGAVAGWSEWTFKGFYLFGAVLNVAFLALGTVYLLCPRRFADRCAAVVSLLAAFATGLVLEAPITGVIEAAVLPQGSKVFGPGPRILAAVGSAVPALVIIGGALWSAWRLFATRREAPEQRARGGLSPGRLAVANLFIAAGTLVLGVGGASNSVLNAMDTFALSLVVGIALIFAGFLLTTTPEPVALWVYRPRETSGRLDEASGDQRHEPVSLRTIA